MDDKTMVIISLTPTQKEILNEIYFGLNLDEAINTSINETIEAYRKMCVVK
jgi:hypothetical protein